MRSYHSRLSSVNRTESATGRMGVLNKTKSSLVSCAPYTPNNHLSPHAPRLNDGHDYRLLIAARIQVSPNFYLSKLFRSCLFSFREFLTVLFMERSNADRTRIREDELLSSIYNTRRLTLPIQVRCSSARRLSWLCTTKGPDSQIVARSECKNRFGSSLPFCRR